MTLSDSVGVHSQEACAPEGGGGRRYFLLRKKISGEFSVGFSLDNSFLGETGAGVCCSMQWGLNLDAH